MQSERWPVRYALLVMACVVVGLMGRGRAEGAPVASFNADLDTATAGVQSVSTVTQGQQVSFDIVVSQATDVAAFSFELQYNQTILVSPTLYGGADTDRNPDANQSVLNSTGRTSACSPPAPSGDSDPNPGVGVAFLSCHSTGATQGPSFSGSGGVVATISFQAVGVGTTSLIFRNVSLYASDGTEIGSCNPTLVNLASCTGGSVTVQPAAVPTLTVDADPNTVGIQSQLNTGSATQVSVDILLSNVTGLGSFSLELQYDQTKLVASTIGAGSDLDRNPNANQAILNSTGRSWACSPPAPSGDVDSATSVGAAFISCYSTGAQAGPDFAAAGAVVASVTFQVVGSGTAALSIRSGSLYNAGGSEIGSCGPVISVVATCGSASLIVDASGAGTATKLAFVQQPSGAPSGTALAVQPVVAVQTAGSVTVSADNVTVVSLSLQSGSGSLSCTNGLSRVVSSGLATFSGCTVTGVGAGYVLSATSTPVLTGAASNAFSMSATGSLGTLRVTTAPAVPAQIFLNGIPRDTWGLTWLDLPAGAYEVSFSDIGGFKTPAPQLVTITTGVTTTFTGNFTQRGFLRVLTSPALSATISVDGSPRNEWGLWTDYDAGTYEVCFGLAQDFTAPGCQQAVVQPGQTTTITGTYSASPGAPGPTGFGFLRVTTSPAAPAQILVDGKAGDSWGLTWLKLAPGLHVVTFSGVGGFAPLGPQVVTISNGVTTSIDAALVAAGTLRVITSPPLAATISVDGTPRNNWGVWTDLAPGAHQVCYGSITGFTSPPCENVNLTSNITTTVTGTYVPN